MIGQKLAKALELPKGDDPFVGIAGMNEELLASLLVALKDGEFGKGTILRDVKRVWFKTEVGGVQIELVKLSGAAGGARGVNQMMIHAYALRGKQWWIDFHANMPPPEGLPTLKVDLPTDGSRTIWGLRFGGDTEAFKRDMTLVKMFTL